MLDSVYRPLGLGAMLVAQDLSILLSCGALVSLGSHAAAGLPLVSSPLWGVMLLLAMTEKLGSICSELAIERDWSTQLAGELGVVGWWGQVVRCFPVCGVSAGMRRQCAKTRPHAISSAANGCAGKPNVTALAHCNANLRRTDLATELVGALIFGYVYSVGGLRASMAFTATLAAAAIPLQLLFIRRIAVLAPGAMLHGRHEPGAGWAQLSGWRSFAERSRTGRASAAAASRPLAARVREQLAHALDGWGAYFRQPILPSSLSFVLVRPPCPRRRVGPSLPSVGLSIQGLHPPPPPLSCPAPRSSSTWHCPQVASSPPSWRRGASTPTPWHSSAAAAPVSGGGRGQWWGCCRGCHGVPGRAILVTPPSPSVAACGFVGTVVGKRLISTIGLVRAGAAALFLQASLLGAATALFAALLSGPPALGPAALFGSTGAAGGSWPMVGGVSLPVVVFAGERLLRLCPMRLTLAACLWALQRLPSCPLAPPSSTGGRITCWSLVIRPCQLSAIPADRAAALHGFSQQLGDGAVQVGAGWRGFDVRIRASGLAVDAAVSPKRCPSCPLVSPPFDSHSLSLTPFRRSLSELLMLGAAAASADPASYPALVYASFAAVVAANLLFRAWAPRAQRTVDAAIAAAAI